MSNASNRFQDQVVAASVGIETRAEKRDARIAAQPDAEDLKCIHCEGPSFGSYTCWACYRAGL